MPRFDATTAECFVFTFKEGLLSKVAHDLQLRATRLQVDWEDGRLHAEVDATGLEVMHAMKDGAPNPGALSDADKAKIAESMADSVLHPQRFPKIVLDATPAARGDGGFDVRGTLTLHGVSRPVDVSTKLVDGRHVAELELYQPDFGITPFKAMMGALKVQPKVRVQVRLPA